MIVIHNYWLKCVLFSDYQQFTLDPNTAHDYLELSEMNRVVTNMNKTQPYPDHPDRFNHWYQLLCEESVCGRCYWEVEWSGRVDISVSYKSISRKGWGSECSFGRNDQSWSLTCSDSFSFWHNNKRTDLPEVSSSSRIGVYVDHGEIRQTWGGACPKRLKTPALNNKFCDFHFMGMSFQSNNLEQIKCFKSRRMNLEESLIVTICKPY